MHRNLIISIKILFILSLTCIALCSFAQEDPTVPIQQRYLNNTLINDSFNNPIGSKNPLIEQSNPRLKQKLSAPKKPVDVPKPKIEVEKQIEPKETKKEEEILTKKEETKDSSKPPETKDNDEGLFKGVRFGPMVGFGILQGPNISLESKLFKYIGLSISYGGYNNLNLFIIPTLKQLLNKKQSSYEFQTLKMDYRQYEAKLSLFPAGGSFFIGVAYGQRTIDLKSTGTITTNIPALNSSLTTSVNENINMKSVYYTPQIGWLSTWSGKFGWFAFGSELGLQFSIKNTVTVTTDFTDPTAQQYLSIYQSSQEYQDFTLQLKKSFTDNLNKYPLPYWNILKFGWMF